MISDQKNENNSKIELKMLSSLRFLGKPAFKKTSLFLVENIFNFMAYENSLKHFIEKFSNNKNYITKIRVKLSEFFHFNKYWLCFFHMIIILNVLVLCLDRYPISKNEQELYETIDFAIFLFYLIEISLKLFAFSPSIFFKSPFNQIDLIIISLNLFFEIYVRFNNFESIGSIRNLKVLRIFRAAYYSGIYESFSFLIKGLVFALAKLRYFIFIVIVLIINVSLIGKEIFAYKIRFEEIDGLKSAHDLYFLIKIFFKK